MKIRVSLSINVTKIDKSRLYEGKKGKYLDATALIDLDEVDKFGNNGFIAEQVSKQERENGVKGTILGNAKVSWKEGAQQSSTAPPSTPSNAGGGDFDSDPIPF